MKVFLLAYIFSVLVALLPGPEQVSQTQNPQTEKAPKLEAQVQKMFDKANELRRREGLAELKLNPELMKAAEYLAKDMAENLYFSHKDRQGRNYKQRADHFGYLGWQWVGENISTGEPKVEDVIKLWLSSPAHKATLLKPEAKDIGLAFAASTKDPKKVYWVVDIAYR